VLRRLTAALAGCLVLAVLSLLVAGCGNSRTAVPDPDRPVAPQGFRRLTVTAAGVALIAPRNWTVASQTAPLVLTINSGQAVIALWRRPRAAPPPAGPAAVAATRRALLTAVRRGDPAIAGLRATATRAAGAPAIRLDARERIDGYVRQVSSTHVYIAGAELVLDEYAPPAEFAAVASTVFAPVLRSLALVGDR
jgi:hypothetical protein